MVPGDIGEECCDRVSALATVRRLQIARKAVLFPIQLGGRRVDEIRSRRGYRGYRRATNTSSGRFIAVLTSAAVGAGVVALGVAAAMPDQGGDLTFTASAQYDDIAARTATADRATRSGGAHTMSTLNQPAPE